MAYGKTIEDLRSKSPKGIETVVAKEKVEKPKKEATTEKKVVTSDKTK